MQVNATVLALVGKEARIRSQVGGGAINKQKQQWCTMVMVVYPDGFDNELVFSSSILEVCSHILHSAISVAINW